MTFHSFAAERGRAICDSSAMTILRPTTDEETTALRVFDEISDQRVSFTDCISFALMKQHGLQRAFTFDRHFASADFGL